MIEGKNSLITPLLLNLIITGLSMNSQFIVHVSMIEHLSSIHPLNLRFVNLQYANN